jgi:chemotaxis protein methyltransferase CheR
MSSRVDNGGVGRHRTGDAPQREFEYRREDFDAIRLLVRESTGIHLSDSKQELVYSRLSRRLRALRLASFREYREVIASGNDAELVHFRNAITTNLTSFFRESHHFDYLRDHVLRPMLANRSHSRRVRIWSAGCSTGEEPYSIAMTLCEAMPERRGWDVRILATDIDCSVVATGARGLYGADRLQGIDTQRLQTFFTPAGDGTHVVTPELRELVTFRQLNLLDPLPMRGPFDVIFCRNVIIYFDKETKRSLFPRIAPLQRPGDLLCLGHAESLSGVSSDYRLIGRTLYRRQ